ncbi:interferon-inducible protein AIM2-like isoform X2 [Dromiciops gliroides]|uniref:interferon-inducible protein AIM2-like isoform X2 n=1 Tax=Dromiciops gliroides TaxID=33562 RepID=UPI001CC813EA|nr:interferon-inducible protein AIM2-like isoform X2 [Dromiciops gliroides]
MPSRSNSTKEMEDQFFKILIDALDDLDDSEFKKCKAFLKHKNIIKKSQEKCDRIDCSNYMIETYGGLSAVKIMIGHLNEINFKEVAQNLQKQKVKVMKEYHKKKEKKPVTRKNQAKIRRLSSNGNNTVKPQLTNKDNLKPTNESKKNDVAKKRKATTEESPENKKRKTTQEFPQTTEQEAKRENGPQIMPMVVKVLNVNQIFEYETKEGTKEMFHATVANEHEFIRVKVLNIGVKEHFKKNKIIEVVKGYWNRGFLEINRCSRVQDMSTNKEITVPRNIIRRAAKNTKIQELKKQKLGSYVNGIYEIEMVIKAKKN